MIEQEKIKVLYVDDEINNLVSFKANFREFYTIFTAESTELAKEILQKETVNILITDQRMPSQNGIQFLESIVKEYPLIVKMILTGYADLETAIDAINKGQIYKYIIKPFNFEELKISIDEAYDLYLFRKSGETALVKFRQLFENHNDPVFIMDQNCNFQELNNFGLNLFKIQEKNLYEVNLSSIFSHSNEFSLFYENLIKNGFAIDFPAQLKDQKNNLIESLISATAIKEQGVIIGYQCIIRDITKQKEMGNLLIKAMIDSQENDRIRLGKNLHDSIGQKLSAIRLFLQTMEQNDENLKSDEMLIKSKEVIDYTINELRHICFNIMPKSLEILGLKGTINEFIKQNRVAGNFEFSFEIENEFPRLNIDLELAIFRIIQEFVNNAIKHGEAKNIEMKFRSELNHLHISLKDNGKGFDPKKQNKIKGNGLKNIQSRIDAYNGKLKIDSVSDKGTTFDIVIPLNAISLQN